MTMTTPSTTQMPYQHLQQYICRRFNLSPFWLSYIIFDAVFVCRRIEFLRRYEKSEDGTNSPWYERYEKSKEGTKSPLYESSMVRKVHKWYETSMVRKVWHSGCLCDNVSLSVIIDCLQSAHVNARIYYCAPRTFIANVGRPISYQNSYRLSLHA